MLCPISWAIPQPNKEPDKYFPFSAASNGIPFDKPENGKYLSEIGRAHV